MNKEEQLYIFKKFPISEELKRQIDEIFRQQREYERFQKEEYNNETATAIRQ